jgi:hypothetical protein
MLTHTVAAVILEIAYLVSGVILCYLGKGLLEKGITGGFHGEGEIVSNKFKLITSSPGIVYAVAGLVIVTVAVITPAEFADNAGTATDGRASLEELKGRVTYSRLGQSSPERVFAQQQLESAVAAAAAGSRDQALVAASTAVVVEPAQLLRVLEQSELRGVIDDTRFVTLVNARFALPNETSPTPAPIGTALLGDLRLYLNLRPELLRATKPAKRDEPFPAATNAEARAITRDRLLRLLNDDPATLLDSLNDTQNQWVLREPELVEPLQARLRELMK